MTIIETSPWLEPKVSPSIPDDDIYDDEDDE
jgi:hypothetical protein